MGCAIISSRPWFWSFGAHNHKQDCWIIVLSLVFFRTCHPIVTVAAPLYLCLWAFPYLLLRRVCAVHRCASCPPSVPCGPPEQSGTQGWCAAGWGQCCWGPEGAESAQRSLTASPCHLCLFPDAKDQNGSSLLPTHPRTIMASGKNDWTQNRRKFYSPTPT